MAGDTPYAQDFYRNRHEQTVYAAERLIELVAAVLPPIRSAVDVGCGVGTWLSVLRAQGIDNVQGYDGSWVDQDLLEIPSDCFSSRDLREVIDAPMQRFDLAISLEVAEHLPESCAENFVTSLTNQSDFVLFSAAVPHQGGRHHVNSQWIEYWVEQFERHGYVGLDLLRNTIWSDEKIQRWYRQNAVLFVARARVDELSLPTPRTDLAPVSLVHPQTLEYLVARHERDRVKNQSLKGSWKLFRRALRRAAGGR